MSTAVVDAHTYVPEPEPPALAAAQDERSVRPALVALLIGTGVLYLWGLGASGWANGFYSAAVQAGSHSWKAFFFGSFDSSSFITVDKPPASLWVMGAAVRLFGLSSWSVLVPQALMGVATVGVVYLAVRRVVGPGAGLLAGAVLATTPVAALMFRFDNPDALLVLLLTTAGYALVRATVPHLEPVIMGGMLGYGPFHYRYASGREGEACRLSIASNASYISLYCFAADDEGDVAERYVDRLPKAKIGKSCVRFKRLADLDEDALVALIRETSTMGLAT